MLKHRGAAPLRPHFWAGIGLLLAGHVLIFARTANGEHVRPLSDYWFAAVWFGYIFALDALLYRRDGVSLFMTQRRVFLATLPFSAAMWWGFEWVNEIVQNWHYRRPYDIPDWWSNLWSCIFFSTVIPAVWETADWVGGWGWVRRFHVQRTFSLHPSVVPGLVALGVLFFVLAAAWPYYFYALIWGALVLILDPLNYKRGYPSIVGFLSRGQWQLPVAFYLGGHICGLLWEFWNYWAFPSWYYTIPFVGFLKIFEMPLLGYIGYGPFAWEIFALFWFVVSLVPGRHAVGLLKMVQRPAQG